MPTVGTGHPLSRRYRRQPATMTDDGVVTTSRDTALTRPIGVDETHAAQVTGPSPLLTSLAPALLLLTLLAAVVLRYSASSLNNTDTWFHLSLGRHFRDDWSLGHPG